MAHYIPMIILMALFGAIGIYWAIATRHFIAWSRKYKNSFPKFSDNNPGLGGEDMAIGAKTEESTVLYWGVRLVGVGLAAVAVASIIDMFITG
jgi:hypothetical protein